MDKLKLIKVIVFILTFLLVFCTLYILGVFFQKTHQTSSEASAPISLKQPMGSYIKEIRADNGLLYILTVGGGQEDRIIIYNPQKQELQTTLKMN